MKRQLIGAALAIIIVTMAALALPSASGDSPDVREAEIYENSAFAYSPSGDWSVAKASGTAIDAGLIWADGTLSGSIGTAGTYRAVIEKADGSVTVELTVLPSVTVNQHSGRTMTGDSVAVSGAKAGSVAFPVTIGGPDGTVVSADCGGLFVFDAEKGFVLKDDLTDSAKGSYALTVRASHESGPLYSEAVLTVTVEIVSASEAQGRDAEGIASLGARTGSTTYVVTSTGTVPVTNASYATPEAPKVSDLKVDSDGRSVRVSSGVTDAQKITYNWGDGTRTSVDVQSVLQAAQHTYRDGGTYTMIVTADGPYASGYGVAVFDAPADGSKGFFDQHGWIFLVFAIGALISVFAFLYARDPRFLIAAAVLAVLTAVTLVMGVKI